MKHLARVLQPEPANVAHPVRHPTGGAGGSAGMGGSPRAAPLDGVSRLGTCSSVRGCPLLSAPGARPAVGERVPR